MSVALAAPARSGSKGWLRGTHRACAPEETWSRIAPLLRAAGITRTSEQTRLDTVGIPVVQAVRPGSRNLVVTLGGGITPMLARVGAAMSALELWHAERLHVPVRWAALAEIRAELGYNAFALPLHTPNLLGDGTVVDWVPATVLLTGRETLVPRACVAYDLSVREEWAPPLFVASADGLAAGNTHAEAVLYALYEVIERDCVAAAHQAPEGEIARIDPGSIDSEDACRMLERLTEAGAGVTILDITGPTRVATFEVIVAAPGAPTVSAAASHLDREVALCRALAAAAAERLARLTGARDDLPLRPARREATAAAAPSAAPRAYRDVPSLITASFAGDVAEVAERVHRSGAGPVLVVDLSRDAVGLPVARVIVPGLRHRAGL